MDAATHSSIGLMGAGGITGDPRQETLPKDASYNVAPVLAAHRVVLLPVVFMALVPATSVSPPEARRPLPSWTNATSPCGTETRPPPAPIYNQVPSPVSSSVVVLDATWNSPLTVV